MQEKILYFFNDISTPVLDNIAELVTMLGEQYFFILIISFIYWNVSKKEGFKLSAAFIFSALLNSVLKISFHSERPFEKLERIGGKRIETATGYSFPSGHTQGATVFFITLSQIVRRGWFTIIAVILMLAVGVSRVYLGVHWPVDVVGGIIFGIITSYAICTIVDSCYDDRARLKKIFYRMEFIIISLTVILFFVDLFVLKGSMKIEDFFKISGISVGAVYGFFIEEKHFDFSPIDAGWFKKILRFIIGLAVAIGLMTGLKIILPEHNLFNYIRYGIVGFWITLFWPALGIQLGLFNRSSRI